MSICAKSRRRLYQRLPLEGRSEKVLYWTRRQATLRLGHLPTHRHTLLSSLNLPSQVSPESWQIPRVLTSGLLCHDSKRPLLNTMWTHSLPWPSRTVQTGNLAPHSRVSGCRGRDLSRPSKAQGTQAQSTLLPQQMLKLGHKSLDHLLFNFYLHKMRSPFLVESSCGNDSAVCPANLFPEYLWALAQP